MKRCRVSRKAIRDLDEIWYALARDSETAAERQIERIESLIRTVAGQPRIGRARPDLSTLIRSIGIDHYVVFYEPTTDGIRILRVWDGRQNPAKLEM